MAVNQGPEQGGSTHTGEKGKFGLLRVGVEDRLYRSSFPPNKNP